jgi:hypothetical protein
MTRDVVPVDLTLEQHHRPGDEVALLQGTPTALPALGAEFVQASGCKPV